MSRQKREEHVAELLPAHAVLLELGRMYFAAIRGARRCRDNAARYDSQTQRLAAALHDFRAALVSVAAERDYWFDAFGLAVAVVDDDARLQSETERDRDAALRDRDAVRAELAAIKARRCVECRHWHALEAFCSSPHVDTETAADWFCADGKK